MTRSRPAPSAGPEAGAAGASLLECAACGARLAADHPAPFRCPRAAGPDDLDHVLVKRLDFRGMTFPANGERHPFVRFRRLLHVYHAARAMGLTDGEWVASVLDLDARVARIAGVGLVETPFRREDRLSVALGLAAPGGVWIKDETRAVAGSHKARHLFGVALWLEAAARARPTGKPRDRARRGAARRLAIASCGNAALAAAVVARALGDPLEVFVPPDAEPEVLERLPSLGATLCVCRRAPGARGDPCVSAFRAAVGGGAIPFTCQGSENGLVLDGGETLGNEIVAALAREGGRLDRLFVQVGGGALASATAQALARAARLGALDRPPRLHAVQTAGCAPLARAWSRVRDRIAERAGWTRDPGAVERMRAAAGTPLVEEALHHAATHRSTYMWPWESVPSSAARGILDDETYDWLEVVRAMIESGGWPIVVPEERIAEAWSLARRETGVPADATGTAGLAGLLELGRARTLAPDESVAVLFTGLDRRAREASGGAPARGSRGRRLRSARVPRSPRARTI